MNEKKWYTAMMPRPRGTVNTAATTSYWRKGARMKMRSTVTKKETSKKMKSVKKKTVELR